MYLSDEVPSVGVRTLDLARLFMLLPPWRRAEISAQMDREGGSFRDTMHNVMEFIEIEPLDSDRLRT